MASRSAARVLRLITLILCAAGLQSPAQAQRLECADPRNTQDPNTWAELADPTSLSLTIQDGVIINRSVQGRHWSPYTLTVPVQVRMSCGPNGVIRAVGRLERMKRPIPGQEPWSMGAHFEKPWEGVPVPDTVEEATVSYRHFVLTFLGHGCREPVYEARKTTWQTSEVRQFKVSYCCLQRGKSRGVWIEKEMTLPVQILCRGLLKARTTPILFRHECPAGYFVEGTRDRVLETDSPDSALQTSFGIFSDLRCISEATAGRKACPFVYTRTLADPAWVEEGTILTHLSGAGQESTQRLPLTGFSGEVLIRELDPETSFFDFLAVEVFHRDGGRETLLATRPELYTIDGSYLTTKQGDAIVIRFREPRDWDFERAELVAHGYYVLYGEGPPVTGPEPGE